jgi:DNA repair protein RadA/Sms
VSRDKALFVCQECGGTSPKWLGRCPDCGAWNSLVEQRSERSQVRAGSSAYAVASSPEYLNAIAVDATTRQHTGLGELDRVLGGGLVAGAAILLGGEPGIGKSTLMLQIAEGLSRSHKERKKK